MKRILTTFSMVLIAWPSLSADNLSVEINNRRKGYDMFKTMMAMLVAVVILGSTGVTLADCNSPQIGFHDVSDSYTFTFGYDAGKALVKISGLFIGDHETPFPAETMELKVNESGSAGEPIDLVEKCKQTGKDSNKTAFTCSVYISELREPDLHSEYFFYDEDLRKAGCDRAKSPYFKIPQQLIELEPDDLLGGRTIELDDLPGSRTIELDDLPGGIIPTGPDDLPGSKKQDEGNVDNDVDVDFGYEGGDIAIDFGDEGDGIGTSDDTLGDNFGFDSDGSGCTLAGGVANPMALILMLLALTPIAIRRRR